MLGSAREEGARDRALSLASVPPNRARRLVRDDPRGTAPVADCSLSPRGIRATAAGIVPGARFRRHLYRRYSMLWTAPGTG
ncbi:hypothetical protein [Saccharothrix lopnurensis]|uniref:Uncharacterized protein n=1 Tax=Saccharothrix lopnurensis TaxID=1670621 RepID=A0ABW1NYI6_9PSEU